VDYQRYKRSIKLGNMFKIDNRKTLTEVIAPPSGGYRFEKGIITTFSLDLDALFGVLLTLRGYDIGQYGTKHVEEGEDVNKTPLAQDPFASIETMSSIIGNNSLIVFCKQGIKGAKKAKILKLLDSIISPVNIEGGRFHPKVWVLKYRNENAERGSRDDLYRFICMSRNLTASNYLEASFCVDGIYNKKNGTKQNENLCAFLKGVMDSTDQHKKKRKEFEDFIKELSKVNFQMKHDFFYQRGGSRKNLRSVCDLGSKRKAVIVSPFMDVSFIKWIFCDKGKKKRQIKLRELDDFIIVSRKDTLNGIFYDLKESKNNKDRDLYRKLFKSVESKKNFYIFKDEGDILSGKSKTAISSLHAKIYLFENGKVSEMYLGSANATNRGWGGGNAEGVIRVNNQYSFDQVKNDFIYKSTDKSRKVPSSYLDPYEMPKKLTPLKRSTHVDDLLSILGELRFRVIYDGKLKKISISIPGVNTQWLEKYQMNALNDVVLVGLPGRNKRIPFATFLKTREFIDYNVTVGDISRFIEVTINKIAYLFVADSNIDKYAQEREKAIFQEYGLSGDKFLEYVRYILMGWEAGLGDGIHERSIEGRDVSEGSAGAGKAISREPVLSMEDILRKCDNENVMNDIRSAISRMKNDVKLRGGALQEFKEFWDSIEKARNLQTRNRSING